MVLDLKNKTKIIFQISAPKSGSKWLKSMMVQHPDIISTPSISLSGVDKIEFNTDKIKNFIKKTSKHCYFWIPHGTTIMDSLSKIEGDIKFIHLIRDGRNVSASYMNTTVKDPEIAANNWKKLVEFGMEYRNNPNYYEVKYEDLVNNIEITMKNLFRFLNIPFDNKVLNTKIQDENSKLKNFNNDIQEKVVKVINPLLKELKY